MTARTFPAILLRSHPYGDTSQILRFLTPELGVVAVIARGVRARRSQGRGGGLELFVPGTLELDHRAGKSLHGFRSFEAAPDASMQGLAREILALAGASYLAELVLAHAVEEEPQPELFPHLETTFRELASAPPDRLVSILLGSGWWILGSFGFPPAVDQCVACGMTPMLSSDDRARFDLMAGGVRCAACASIGTGPRLGPGALSELRQVVRGERQHRLRGALGLFRLLDRFARLHLGLERTFRSTPTVEERIRSLMPDESENEELPDRS